MIGIAGQLSTKVHLGDVVIGRHILHWDSKRKEKEGTGDNLETDYALTPAPSAKWGAGIANLLKSDMELYEKWREHCLKGKPTALTSDAPVLHIEDIASGSATIDSEKMRQMLSGLSRYLFAVETEAAGALTALQSRNPDARSILIRGISDHSVDKIHSDSIGEGAWRQYAASNAAKLLILILSTYSISMEPSVYKTTGGDFRKPSIKKRAFDPYNETLKFIDLLANSIKERCSEIESDGFYFSDIEDSKSRKGIRITHNGKAVYSLNVCMGGIGGDTTISFHGTRGSISSNQWNTSNGWGKIEWDKEKDSFIIEFQDLSLFNSPTPNLHKYTYSEFIDALWHTICDVIETSV
jgi:nucleoside phosphorylase